MRIISIDPSLSNIGVVIYDYNSNKILLSQTITYKDSDKRVFKKTLIKDGIINENNEREYLGSMWSNNRLAGMLKIINEEASNRKVNLMLSESQFGFKLTDASAIPKIVAGNLSILYKDYRPTSWKKILTGNGKCSEDDIKEEVKKFVGVYFKHLDEHQIDAFALILCYLKINNMTIKEILP